VSSLGRVTALAAEAALWITGAALIAGAAGMQWNVDLPIDTTLLSGPTPYVATTPGPSASPAGPSLAPGASPTISPVAKAYQAYIARTDYQVEGKYTIIWAGTVSGSAYEADQNGTFSYKAGDQTESYRETIKGVVTTYDKVAVGGSEYDSKNGGAWTKTARAATDAESAKLLFAPAMLFVDKGIETKNGAQLHRLELADPGVYNRAMLKASDNATDAFVSYVVWVQDDGTPAALSAEGWVVEPVNGASVKMTVSEEFRIIATSGVTIVAPKV
jgi:hypothetical protein